MRSSRMPICQDGQIIPLTLTNVIGTTPEIDFRTEKSAVLWVPASYAASAIIYCAHETGGTFGILQDNGGNNQTLTFTTAPGGFALPSAVAACPFLKLLLNAANTATVYLCTQGN